MRKEDPDCLKKVREYLEDEHIEKKSAALDMSDWTLVMEKDIPHQTNGMDCGMFVCKYAECLSRRAVFSFSQDNMSYYRYRMVWELKSETIIYP